MSIHDKELAALAPAVEANLRRHVLAPWFPHAVDAKSGGFHQNYAADWRPLPDDVRSVVYQSRLTWVASQAVLRTPTEADVWRGHARHGLSFLNGALWDAEHGGWFWEVGASGPAHTPGRGREKHAYGIAFALYACAAAHRATGDPRALKRAKEGFAWLDAHAHDARYGGYHEQLTRTGARLVTPPPGGTTDPIGTVYGRRSMNTHIHLLEAFAALHEVWPDSTLAARLAEVFAIVRDKVAAPEGRLHLYLTPDWAPIPGVVSFGHDVETAYLLDEAAHALGADAAGRARAETVGRRLVDHALAKGWDAARGGFYNEGEPGGKVTHPRKVWWTQAEGLNALLLMHRKHGRETPRYADAFRRQWAFIEAKQVDRARAGWRRDVAADGKPDPAQTKSDAWTDPYHQGRALMNVAESLRALA
jgi:mannobiose 2-epimerase